MKFEESMFHKDLKHFKLELDFGTYYLCDKFVIGELNEGIHFDFEKADTIAEKLVGFYGISPELSLISNRVNSYSVEPQNWTRVLKFYPKLLRSSCIISYNTLSQFNADLEKRFFSKTIVTFETLAEGINWAQNFDRLSADGKICLTIACSRLRRKLMFTECRKQN